MPRLRRKIKKASTILRGSTTGTLDRALPAASKNRSSRKTAQSKDAKRQASEPIMIPKRYLKFLIGLVLLIPAWILTQTFFGALTWATIEQQFWMSEEFWFFSLGAILWLVIFASVPGAVCVYVFGHEWTHALAVWAMGGKVDKIQVGFDGGFVLADRINTWIALAPYFVPLYSVLVLLGYVLAGLFFDMAPFYQWFLGALGFTWAFHFSFTCWMIPKGQSDLTYGGNFYSLVVIYLANLVILSFLLVAGSPEVSAKLFFGELFHNTGDFLEKVEAIIKHPIAVPESWSRLIERVFPTK